jgi:uncharacterized membrane protein YdjX (TVP38/TMEM64 family)
MFLAGSLILPAGHSRKHRFLLQSKPGGKTAYAETRDKGGASVSSADSELDRLESAAEKEVENGVDVRASSGNGVAKGEEEEAGGGALASGGALAGVLLVATLATMAGLGYMYKDQINTALIQFQGVLETLGPSAYVIFVFAYAGLEVLAIPAIPLTMSAGLLFGQVTGTVIVSAAGTLAATISFLIARYLARDRILKIAEKNPKFVAIDKAIGKESFKVVTLLRLSPLLPFSVGNYLYGLTSVKLMPYVLGSWIGMLPGTFAYVSAGNAGKTLLQDSADGIVGNGPSGQMQLISLGLGLLATIGATWYVGKLAKNAVDDIEK